LKHKFSAILLLNIKTKKGKTMLWTIIVILAVLWLLGLLFEIGGGIVHILLVIAVILVIVNLVSGRKTL